jgi:uncharacterized membrane protein
LIKSNKTVFVKNREKGPDGLLPHEQSIYNGIFALGDEVDDGDLKEVFYKSIPGIKTAVHDRLVQLGSFRVSPLSVRNRFVVFGVLAAIATFALGALSAGWTGAIFPHALVVPIVAGVLTLGLFLGFAPAMPQRTRKGVEEQRWALGFQEFVRRVEEDRLEREIQSHGTSAKSVFEKLLPYAMALGVASTWAKRFHHLYQDQSPPSWYAGRHFTGQFSTVQLEKNLSTSMAGVAKNMAASPRSSGSSGSGGGGFSGGGGGGGGGGSW